MTILVVGATGFIGSALIGRLHKDGRRTLAVVRTANDEARRLPARLVQLDIARATRAEDWLPHLQGVEAVVNCAGVLQDSATDSTAGVHVAGAGALFEACARAGVKRVIHLSAIGTDKGVLTPFGETKRQGEEILMQSALDWVVLRPSVVVGAPAYGGSALFRGLASLPVLPVLPDTGKLQVVQLDEVVATIVAFLDPDMPSRVTLDIAGPEQLTMTAVVASYRRWLGWKPARLVAVPGILAGMLYRLGDAISYLGWRPPVRTTARREMVRGATGDPSHWMAATSIVPQSLDSALAASPASVQERWFAPLYVLKPALFAIFSLFWIATAIVSLGPGYEIGRNLMLEAGAGALAGPSVIAGAIADLCIGLAIAYRPTARFGLYAALAISLFYFLAGSILVPRLWAEPLGPLLKIWPILGLNLVLLAILRGR